MMYGEPEEYASGHVSGAVNVPLDELLAGPKQLIDVSKNVEIVLFCRTHQMETFISANSYCLVQNIKTRT